MSLSMDLVRGLMITLLAIISYLLISSLYQIEGYDLINLLIIIISLSAGAAITVLNRGMSRKDLNLFRILLFVGLALFVVGTVLIYQKTNESLYDLTIVRTLTFGLLIASIGLILILSQIPPIIYHNLKEIFKLKKKK